METAPAPAADPRPASEPVLQIKRVERALLARNDDLAAKNRAWLRSKGIAAWNLMSSPGAGKTTLLEMTVRALGPVAAVHVIEGDQATNLDGERIRNTGCRVVQVNTGAACHLDAAMISDALRLLNPPQGSTLFIENVGNLVCPSLFDLGETARVVVASVPEGADKPFKYPHMFRSADLVILNKIDLLPFVAFDKNVFYAGVEQQKPGLPILELSLTRGDGFKSWIQWIHSKRALAKPGVAG